MAGQRSATMAGGMRGPGEGLHEGPAPSRGGRGKGATPQPMAGPRGRDRHAAPPPRRQEAAPGDQRPPPTEAGPGYRGLRLRILMELIFSWVLGFHLWVFQTP